MIADEVHRPWFYAIAPVDHAWNVGHNRTELLSDVA
jgi:hypothetical protein